MLNMSKSQLNEKLQHKTEFLFFNFYSILEEKILKIYDSWMVIPINKWKLMHYHHPREIHDSLLEMELKSWPQSLVLRIDRFKMISLTLQCVQIEVNFWVFVIIYCTGEGFSYFLYIRFTITTPVDELNRKLVNPS